MNGTPTLYGRRVYLNPLLTTPGDPVEVRRPWRERLFSRPWRPWAATRTAIPQVPSREVFFLGETALAMHPDTWERIRQVLHKRTPPS